jgi:hypothetical protein
MPEPSLTDEHRTIGRAIERSLVGRLPAVSMLDIHARPISTEPRPSTQCRTAVTLLPGDGFDMKAPTKLHHPPMMSGCEHPEVSVLASRVKIRARD